jgi:hypothetical protein
MYMPALDLAFRYLAFLLKIGWKLLRKKIRKQMGTGSGGTADAIVIDEKGIHRNDEIEMIKKND